MGWRLVAEPPGRSVGDRDDRDRLPVFHALDRHLGLDPEPVGGEVEPAERLAGERPIPGEDIPVLLAVDRAKREG